MILLRNCLFSKSRGLAFYHTRRIYPIESTMSVYEFAPGQWDILDHGFAPWIFHTDTNGRTEKLDSLLVAARTKELIPR